MVKPLTGAPSDPPGDPHKHPFFPSSDPNDPHTHPLVSTLSVDDPHTHGLYLHLCAPAEGNVGNALSHHSGAVITGPTGHHLQIKHVDGSTLEVTPGGWASLQPGDSVTVVSK